jgi:hypothetical protein
VVALARRGAVRSGLGAGGNDGCGSVTAEGGQPTLPGRLHPDPDPLRSRRKRLTLLLPLLIWTGDLDAQERRPEGGPPARMNPLFAALDTNGDGTVDAAELAAAPGSLKKLERNGDGS